MPSRDPLLGVASLAEPLDNGPEECQDYGFRSPALAHPLLTLDAVAQVANANDKPERKDTTEDALLRPVHQESTFFVTRFDVTAFAGATTSASAAFLTDTRRAFNAACSLPSSRLTPHPMTASRSISAWHNW